jgi:PKD-like domain
LYKHFASKIATYQIKHHFTKLPIVMRKILISALLLLCTSPCIWAQITKVCTSDVTPPADLCFNACVYCDFNGITGTTAGYKGQNVNSGCMGAFENESWLGLIANCNSITLIATPSNCKTGNGLQFGVYKDCSSAPIACNPGFAGGGLIPVIVTAATIPGQTYLLVIDGYAGDQCEFNVTVAPPQCAGAPLIMPTLPIQGPNQVCPSSEQVYSVPAISGASSYVWNGPGGSLINGQTPPITLTNGNMTQVTVTMPNGVSGTQEICVQPMNACTVGTETCKMTTIKKPTILQFPQVYVCPEDLPYTMPWGQKVDQTGFYEATLVTAEGCDSILRQYVAVRVSLITVLAPIFLCTGQKTTVCGNDYGAGHHEVKCTAANGCDSTVIFSVTSFPNTVYPVAGNLCGQSSYIYCGKTYTSPGIYLDSCQTGGGCVGRYQLTLVDQPISLQVGSLVQPTGTSSNGSITMTATGGTGVYTYFWDDGSGVTLSTMSTVSQLPAGVYRCVVSDQAGCQNIIEVKLTAISGVNDLDLDPDFALVQPNPAADFVTITSRKLGDAPIRLEISTADGRLIKSIPQYVFGTEISLVDLPKAALLFKLRLSDGQILTKKVLRQ